MQYFPESGAAPDDFIEVEFRADFVFEIELFGGQPIFELGNLAIGRCILQRDCDLTADHGRMCYNLRVFALRYRCLG